MAKLIGKGGKGSGNWNHAGRPGKVGGSAPRDGVYLQGELFDRRDYVNIDAAHGMEKLVLHHEFGDSLAATPRGDDDIDNVYAEDWWQHMSKSGEDISDDVTVTLSEMTGLSPFAIRDVIGNWKNGSNGDYDKEMIQRAVAAVFHDTLGTDLSEWQKSEFSPYSDPDFVESYGKMEPTFFLWDNEPGVETMREKFTATKKLVAAMYELTQKRFHDSGVKRVTLYRGYIDMNGVTDDSPRRGDDVVIDENALSSWSSDPNVARSFMKTVHDQYYEDSDPTPVGYVISANFPAERILSFDETGFSGNVKEAEFTVIGSSEDDIAHVSATEQSQGSVE